ncbi:MAG: DUF6505 family protein [Beijerinckiaceae bacterium]|nr:DUF6505 family protein [Beijerinckiaceae bacterium]
MKLPRVIRLDPSDTFIFERAAEPGEWAVSGGFLFAGCDPDAMQTKERHAFRSGFLGTGSLGFSTLVTVSLVTETERAAAVAGLADSFLTLGAPSRAEAEKAAHEEIAFAASLCDHPEGTLIAMERRMDEGEVRERFRTLKPRENAPGSDKLHAFSRAFTFHEVEGEEEPEEQVDLVALMNTKAPGRGPQ